MSRVSLRIMAHTQLDLVDVDSMLDLNAVRGNSELFLATGGIMSAIIHDIDTWLASSVRGAADHRPHAHQLGVLFGPAVAGMSPVAVAAGVVSCSIAFPTAICSLASGVYLFRRRVQTRAAADDDGYSRFDDGPKRKPR